MGVWKHPFIYVASGAGVGPGSGFAGVCASALTVHGRLSIQCDSFKRTVVTPAAPIVGYRCHRISSSNLQQQVYCYE